MRPRKLGRTSSHRKALVRNQASSLLRNGRIVTTLAKAKVLRPFMEKRISRAVRALLAVDTDARIHHMRQLRRDSQDKSDVKLLVHIWARHFKDRPGGYLRIIKLGPRPSDSAPMAVIEFVLETMEETRSGQVVSLTRKVYQERFQRIVEMGERFPIYGRSEKIVALAAPRPRCGIEIKDAGSLVETVVNIDPPEPLDASASEGAGVVSMWMNVAFVYDGADYRLEQLRVPDYVDKYLAEDMESLSFLRFRYQENMENGRIVAVFRRLEPETKAHFKMVLESDFKQFEVGRIFPSMLRASSSPVFKGSPQASRDVEA